jgi:starvation-inducible DNA-binding protein
MAQSPISKTTLHETKNPLPQQARQELADMLNGLLASSIDLRLRAKQAHWNLKGPSFIGLHELFDSVAEDVNAGSDDIAERVVQLGGQAYGTVQAVASHTMFDSYDKEATDQMKHVETFTADLATFIGRVNEATERAGELDPLTEDLLVEVGRTLGLRLYFLESHLK